MQERICGYVASKMDGIQDAKNIVSVMSVPSEYDLSEQTQFVVDQGDRGICASVALSDIVNWKGKSVSKQLNPAIDYFYNRRKDKSVDGMSAREAFDMAVSDFDLSIFAKIQDIDTLKKSIFASGPCMLCLPVKSFENDFWKGSKLYGGHAIVAVGWTREGIKIKNSWGTGYGKSGYWILPNEDFRFLYEAWVLLA